MQPDYKTEQQAAIEKRRMITIIPNGKAPGTKFRMADPQKIYVVTGSGQVGLIDGHKPWRNKAERKQVLRNRREDRQMAAANLKGGVK